MDNNLLKRLEIKGTPLTPEVLFDNITGILEIKGRSIRNNVQDFFPEILDWIKDYSANPLPETTINIHLEYIQTAAFKIMLDAFLIFKQMHITGKKVVVNWYFEEDDNDILETGVDYSTVSGIPFNMIQV